MTGRWSARLRSLPHLVTPPLMSVLWNRWKNRDRDKLVPGGVIVFDDYGLESCYGARVAVDAFFAGRPETPLCLPTGQAVVVRGPA